MHVTKRNAKLIGLQRRSADSHSRWLGDIKETVRRPIAPDLRSFPEAAALS
jgi:hypothetical protein